MQMKEWVSVQGSGPSTVIRSARSLNPPLTIFIENRHHVSLRDLSIESQDATGVYIGSSTGIELSGVTVSMTDGTAHQEGVRLDGSTDVTIVDSVISTTGAASGNRGVQMFSSSTAVIERTSVHVGADEGSPDCSGIVAGGATLDLVDVTVTASGCDGVLNGVQVDGLAVASLRGVRVELTPSAGSLAAALRVTGATATVDASRLSGVSGYVLPVYADSSTVLVRDSTLVGQGYGYSLYRDSGDARAIDVVLYGASYQMAGRCVGAVNELMNPYTCV